MSKTITLLGSTGSIGTQSLDVIRAQGYRVHGLAAHSRVDLLLQQVREFRPDWVAVVDQAAADRMESLLAGLPAPPRLLRGPDGLIELARHPVDAVLNAVVGIAGLGATLAAIESGNDVALANKESLVTGGHLVTEAVRKNGVHLLPVDSEHSAIFQCLQDAHSAKTLTKILLTASGGPFFGMKRDQLAGKTRADALKHPNWNMGAKITIDSATLMNKGLEFIEAMHLYHMSPEKISIVIHRESIIHSLVEYCDNAVIAQLGTPDMRLPIQYALTWPRRVEGPATPLDLCSCGPLTFAQPDLDTFRCLALALKAARTGGTAGAILNGANEAAVYLFLDGTIGFLDIADRVERAMDQVKVVQDPTMTQILEADQAAREAVLSA